MRRSIAATTVIALGVLALPAIAQTTSGMAASAPGKGGVAQTVKAVGTITAIDAATRSVTIKGPKGNETTVTVGPEAKNFANMKVGDQVNFEYVEALTLELKKGGKAVVARTEESAKATAKPGAAPAAAAGRQVKVVADVTAVDAATQVVTLKGPNKTVEIKVRDPEQFKLVKVGDQVEATYTEAVAISVEPVQPAGTKKK